MGYEGGGAATGSALFTLGNAPPFSRNVRLVK
jgi:hypothetical protein